MSVVVTQLGVRRHYLVPVALQEQGLLYRFYTDLYIQQGLAQRTVSRLAHIWRLGKLARLASRTDTGLPAGSTRSFPLFGMKYNLYAAHSRRRSEITKAWLWGGKSFASLCARAGFGEANAVFAYSSAALETFEAARKQGVVCILDQATAPHRPEMDYAQREYDRYPGRGVAPSADAWIDEYTARQRREAELANVIICGSSFVRNMVEDAWQFGHKCAVVPLGMRTAPDVPSREARRDGQLRVLFVGDEGMRKGLPELVTALKSLPREEFAVRTAGKLDLTSFGLQQVREVLTTLGAVPRAEMSRQYQWADVMVLPSTSDTFGLVVLEALAHGVPVIASTHTGACDAITDGENGFTIPPYCPESITAKLLFLSRHRDQLPELSRNAIERSRDFSLESYSARLIEVIQRAITA